MQSPSGPKTKPPGEAALVVRVRFTSPGCLETQPHHRPHTHPITAPEALSQPRDLMAELEHWQDGEKPRPPTPTPPGPRHHPMKSGKLLSPETTGRSARCRPKQDQEALAGRHSPLCQSAAHRRAQLPLPATAAAPRLFPVPADMPSRLTQLPAVTIPQHWPGPPRAQPLGRPASPQP